MAVEVPEDSPAPRLDGDLAADLVMQISHDDDDSSDGSSVGENDDVEIIEAEENDDAESTDDESSEMPELKFEDAEFAGGSESQECTLIFTQGLSTTIVALDGVASLKEKHVFYSLPEYEAWRESLRGNASGWAIEKDVAGFGEGDAGMDYFKKLLRKKKDFVWVDERDDEAIELAFSKKFEVGSLQSGMHLDHEEKVATYSDFVDKELIPFSILAVLQCLFPSMIDGLKPHQRQIPFASFRIDYLIKEAIVAECADYVATVSSRPVCELSAYYHDRQSLDSTIIEMAQACVGSKNINLLEMARQLGEDNHLSIQFSPITRFLFPKDNDKLLDYLHEDGISIEPTWYLPIIPTVLVNGFEGTGPAGWTSYIPSYNPRDIVENMKRLINDDKMAPVVPWYRGFTGTIEKTVTDSGVCYTTCGIIKREDESTLRITELPIGSCIKDYLEFLGSISEVHGLAEDHMIKGYEDLSNIDVDILIHLSDTVKNLKEASKEDLCKTFKLTSLRSMSNMHLFNPKGEIKRYDTPEQILEEFFHLRLQFYEKRKTALLLTLRSHLSKLENKVALMSDVLDGGVVDVNKLSTDLYLKAMSIITLVSRDSCPEMLQVLLADIDRINLKVKKLEGSTPRTLWLEELVALELELDKLEKQKFIGLHLPVLHWKQLQQCLDYNNNQNFRRFYIWWRN